MSDKIPSILKRRLEKARELATPAQERLEVNRNLYKNTINVDENYEWEYALSDPHVFPMMRNYLSRANPSKTHIKLEATRKDAFEHRQVNQQLLNWELGEILMTYLFYRMFFSGFIAGKGYCKTGWKYEPAVKISVTDEEGNIQTEKIMRDVINRADAKFVRFNDLLIPNRNIPILEEQPYVIELTQQRVGDMLEENERLEERGEKPYWDKKWLKDLKKSSKLNKLLDFQVDMVTDADMDDDKIFRSAYVALACHHTAEGDVFYLPIEGEDEIVNNDTTNRYWHGHYPYIDYTPFPEDDEFYSLSIVDVVGDLQIAATEIMNQNLTNIRQINNDMWIAGTSAAQTPDWQFQKRPNGVIRVVGDVSQIQNVRTQDNSLSALRMGQDLQTKIERASGISALYASGSPSQNINQTARGAQIIEQNIEGNMKLLVDLFGEQVVKRLGEHFLELNSQYITEEQTFMVTGKRNVAELVHIAPEQVTASFKVTANPDTMLKITPVAQQASMQNLIAQLANIQNMSQGAVQVDLVGPTEALIDAYPELDNIGDDIVSSVDEKAQRDILMLERGQLPEIKARDPHKELITIANIHFEENQMNYPEEIAQMFEQYAIKHLRYIQGEQEIMAMAQPQMPQAMSPEQMQGQMQGQGQMPVQNIPSPDQAGRPDQGYNLKPITLK
jgi:hypothetical protein